MSYKITAESDLWESRGTFTLVLLDSGGVDHERCTLRPLDNELHVVLHCLDHESCTKSNFKTNSPSVATFELSTDYTHCAFTVSGHMDLAERISPKESRPKGSRPNESRTKESRAKRISAKRISAK
jgi:hypothetical protein